MKTFSPLNRLILHHSRNAAKEFYRQMTAFEFFNLLFAAREASVREKAMGDFFMMLEHTPPAYLTKEERADQVATILAMVCCRTKEKARQKKKSFRAYIMDSVKP